MPIPFSVDVAFNATGEHWWLAGSIPESAASYPPSTSGSLVRPSGMLHGSINSNLIFYVQRPALNIQVK